MSTTAPETFEFQTEARQLLDLMIHSVYSHPEIFLRELISNASDALDKLRFEALTDESLAPLVNDLHIRIAVDGAARTLTVSDNGIGMGREEIIRFIGTIAKSGTKEFQQALKDAQKSGMPPELIGQFGVGFYSSFMAADRVMLVTRRAGTSEAWRWESGGDGTYTIEPTEKDANGTDIILHLKPVEGDDAQDFTKEWVVRSIVRKYSDFVSYPIRMRVQRTETVDGKETVSENDETLNSMKAIWTRPTSEVTDEEYEEFYKHVSHDWSAPLKRIMYSAEGASEFRALLFIPSQAPFGLHMRDDRDSTGIHLYIKRVFIMSDCRELIPEYLRFVRGVVDSEDLSLNISREILQQNRQIGIIRKGLTKKVIDTLRQMMQDEPENYWKFWQEFGSLIKEGVFSDAANREALLELCLFPTTWRPEEVGEIATPWERENRTTIQAYVARMKPGQEEIFHLTGSSLDSAEQSPHLEAFRKRGVEVLLLPEPVDEVWTGVTSDYKSHGLKSAAKGEVKLGSEEEQKRDDEARKEQTERFEALLGAMQKHLDADVKEVRLSSRLDTSPACVVADEFGMTPHLEKLLKAAGREVQPSKRILEINPTHAVVERLLAIHTLSPGDDRIGGTAELLFGQALLADGAPLPKPGAFARSLSSVIEKALEVPD